MATPAPLFVGAACDRVRDGGGGVDDSSGWDVLEIAPTAELALIRRAYAARLKTIDVEGDPRAFIALREAYDSARAGLSEVPRSAPPLAEALEQSPKASAARSPEQLADTERLAREILSLLASSSPLAAIEEPLTELTLRLLDAVDRETVDRRFESEQWIASAIADNVPRSDAMIRPAVAYFQWLMLRAGQYRADKASLVVQRLRDLQFAEFLVLREGGRHHLAYLTLQNMPETGFFAPRDYEAMTAVAKFFREAGAYPQVANMDFDKDLIDAWHRHLLRHDLGIKRWKQQRSNKWSELSRVWRYALGFIVLAIIVLIAFAAIFPVRG